MANDLRFGVTVAESSEEANMYDDAYGDHYQVMVGGFTNFDDAHKYRNELVEALEIAQGERDIVFTFSGIKEPGAGRRDDPKVPTPAIEDVLKELLG